MCKSCNRPHTWQNQPVVSKLPLLNLLLSAAILIAGCGVAKTFRIFKYMKVCFVKTYRKVFCVFFEPHYHFLQLLTMVIGIKY